MSPGAQFRSEEDQGVADDTAGAAFLPTYCAGNNLNMECSDGQILEGVGDPWGEWWVLPLHPRSSWVSCPEGSAVCGLKTLVEPEGRQGTRWSLALY